MLKNPINFVEITYSLKQIVKNGQKKLLHKASFTFKINMNKKKT